MIYLKKLLFGAVAGMATVVLVNFDSKPVGAQSSSQGQSELILAQAEGAKRTLGAGSSARAAKGPNNATSASRSGGAGSPRRASEI